MILRRRRLLSITPFAALAACSAPPTLYYQLASLPGPVFTTAPQSIRIRNISIPAYLDQTNIAKPSALYQFAAYPNALWSEPLAGMLQSTLVENLAQRLPRMTITGSTGAIASLANLLVEINILRFDPAPSGDIILIAQIALKTPNAGFLSTKTLQSSATPTTPDAPGTAAAMSTLWASLANELAKAAAS